MRIRLLQAFSPALVALAAAGCSGSITAAPVDAPAAREALKTTLEAWKQGGDLESLKKGSPSITAQDMEWMAGARLADFQVDGEGEVVGSNLRVPVRLSLRGKDGKPADKKVNYLVGTSPSVTVFRDFR